MALVWADGFDFFGTVQANMLQAGYTFASVIALANGQGRTGNFAIQIAGDNRMVKRPLDTPTGTLGQGVAVFPNIFPAATRETVTNGIRWESAGAMELMVVPNAARGLSVVDRTNTVKGASAPNILQGSSWQWIEAKAIMNVGGVVNTGSVEIRVQGQVKLIVNGLNLPNQFAFHCLGCNAGGLGSFDGYFDDWIVWDTSGTKNNDFMGDRRLFPSLPTANGANQNFIPSSGTAFDRINDVPPVDTSYIEGLVAGDISDFAKTAIGINANDVAAVMIWGRVFKTDAGVASFRLGIESGAFVQNSAELFPGIGGSWWTSIVERDPNGTIDWTKVNVDAASLRITRVQ